MKKLAIVVTHPIQYYVPVFQLLAKQVTLKVFFTGGAAGFNKHDKGFGQDITWDLPLLEGYAYEFLRNIAILPGSHHFLGVVNRDALRKITDFNPSALLIYGWAYVSHLRILQHFHGRTPILFRGDSKVNQSQSLFKDLLKTQLLNWVYKHVDTALYVGKSNKDYFKKYKLKDGQLVFAPHTIDNKRFQQSREKEADALRTKLGIQKNGILLLFAGKLTKIKNPKMLLQAFCEESSLNTHLVFVGSGELLFELQAYTAQQQASTRVHFLPFQNQSTMPVIYQASDIFCMTTKYPGETWGLAINEAMAAGTAILASDQVTSAVELVSDENGKLFHSEDLTNLKEKLKAMLLHKQTLKEMGRQSQKVISSWNMEKQVDQILANV
jgi:glycosyltransferase involved in cell wall biosynthesis